MKMYCVEDDAVWSEIRQKRATSRIQAKLCAHNTRMDFYKLANGFVT